MISKQGGPGAKTDNYFRYVIRFIKQLGFTSGTAEGDYLKCFKSAEGRAALADRFVALADRVGADVTVYYQS